MTAALYVLYFGIDLFVQHATDQQTQNLNLPSSPGLHVPVGGQEI